MTPQKALIRITGIVQGVGFRPFVWRLARDYGLSGWVLNDSEGVLIEVCGQSSPIDVFVHDLRSKAPVLARVDRVVVLARSEESSAPTDPIGFEIRASESSRLQTGIPCDAVPCPDCIDDITNPASRRFFYPFTNCTHCGPRYSIIQAMPYDRALTSMASFVLCPDCQAEYHQPADRRFHAQPTCCSACGPEFTLYRQQDGKWQTQTRDIQAQVMQVSQALLSGDVLAIKGVGGYHLVCDATDSAVVAQLRQKKRRPHKPLAVMVKDMVMAAQCADLIPLAMAWLSHPSGCIVLIDKQKISPLADNIAPDQAQVGLMLPMSPIHHLLMAQVDRPLVFTSANLSGEGQIFRDEVAYHQLNTVADGLWIHNRPIVRRLEDSVVRVFKPFRNQPAQMARLRLGRGFSPLSLPIPEGFDGSSRLSATGAESKPHIAISLANEWRLSQFIGQLTAFDDTDGYQQVWQDFHQLHQHSPEKIMVDAHPNYQATQLGLAEAERLGATVQRVYHHHAHLAACMAEHGLPKTHPPVMGLILDGIGLGESNQLLGCELLYGGYAGVEHCVTLSPVPLLGGELANRQPWRNLLARLTESLSWQAVQQRWSSLEVITALQRKPIALLLQAKEKGINAPLSSSAGRLFDAIACILSLADDEQSYEGQSAMMLESLLTPESIEQNWHKGYVVSLVSQEKGNPDQWRVSAVFEQILQDVSQGVSKTDIACRFHLGLARGLVQAVENISQEKACDQVFLSGGVWQNLWLVALFKEMLPDRIQLFTHQHLPANDANIAIGQLAIGG